jgi:putative phosphoesterase
VSGPGHAPTRSDPTVRVGLISDTHGLLRPEAVDALRGSDHIIHGGDIGDAGILEALREIAPVTAVRGNNDRGPWAEGLPQSALVRLAAMQIYVIHDLAELDVEPRAAGIGVVVSGHSHRPRVEQRDGVWYVNPGSSGPRRFKLPVSVGELVISGRSVQARWIELSMTRARGLRAGL